LNHEKSGTTEIFIFANKEIAEAEAILSDSLDQMS